MIKLNLNDLNGSVMSMMKTGSSFRFFWGEVLELVDMKTNTTVWWCSRLQAKENGCISVSSHLILCSLVTLIHLQFPADLLFLRETLLLVRALWPSIGECLAD